MMAQKANSKVYSGYLFRITCVGIFADKLIGKIVKNIQRTVFGKMESGLSPKR